MSLRDKLGQLKPGSAGTVQATELGEGEVVHVRLMSLRERSQYMAVVEDKNLSMDDRYKRLLPLCVCEADGSPVFSGPDDPLLASFTGLLADRVITEAGRLNFRGKDDPKAPSSSTPKPS